MAVGNIFVIVILSYYSMYFIKLLNSKRRQAVKKTNIYLDGLRKVPVKTIEEQKQFLDVKYPKRDKFQFSWKMIPPILLHIIIFVGFIQGYLYLFRIFNINLKFWHMIIIIIVLPILINILLERFNLEMDTIKSYIRWKK